MADLREQIIDAIRTIRDPELPINIHDLGLIRDIAIEDDADYAELPCCRLNANAGL